MKKLILILFFYVSIISVNAQDVMRKDRFYANQFIWLNSLLTLNDSSASAPVVYDENTKILKQTTWDYIRSLIPSDSIYVSYCSGCTGVSGYVITGDTIFINISDTGKLNTTDGDTCYGNGREYLFNAYLRSINDDYSFGQQIETTPYFGATLMNGMYSKYGKKQTYIDLQEAVVLHSEDTTNGKYSDVYAGSDVLLLYSGDNDTTFHISIEPKIFHIVSSLLGDIFTITDSGHVFIPNLADTTGIDVNTKVLISTGGIGEVKRIDADSLVNVLGWGLNGNTGTTALNYIGTTDAHSLRFKTNNTQRMYIDSVTGNIGINTNAPKSLLDLSNGTYSFFNVEKPSNLTGLFNNIIGDSCGISLTSGHSNFFAGHGTAMANTTGYDNIAIGKYALNWNSIGSSNVAIGTDALGKISQVGGLVAVGCGAGYTNQEGLVNTYIGLNSGYSNRSGSNNTYIGNSSGAFSQGGSNTALGASALSGGRLEVNYGNSATGYYAIQGVTTGIYNTGNGNEVLYNDSSGSYNTAFGNKALFGVYSASNCIGIGNYSGKYSNLNNRFYLTAFDQTNIAGDSINSLLYGYMNATSSLQRLSLNANTTIKHGLTVNENGYIAGSLGVGVSASSKMDIWGNGTSTGLFTAYNDKNAVWDSIFCVDKRGYTSIGTSLFTTKLTVVEKITTSPRGIMSWQINNGTEGARLHLRKDRGTDGSPVIVQTGDMIGRVVGSAYDGANFLEMAGIDFGVSGTVAATRIPTYISFFTATDAAPSVLTERMRILNNGNIGIGTTTPTTKLEVQGTSIHDLPTYSAEFLLSTGWTSTNWTGDFATGWTHTVGNTTVLSQSKVAVSATKYQIAYTVTNRTAGSFTIDFGGQSITSITETGTFGPTTSSTANLTITPTSDFDGTIVISIKSITAISTPLVNLKSSDGVVRIEMRANTTTGNTFIGEGSGRYTTTGTNNTANGYRSLYSNTTGSCNSTQGYNSLYSNTTGNYNSAHGYNSLFSNTTGSRNSAQGYNSLLSNTTGNYNSAQGYNSLFSNTTGSRNSANGYRSLYSNTTGNYNSAQGYDAGSFIADGTTGRTTGNNGLYLGYNSKASADGTDNEIVIGYNAIGQGSNTAVYGNTSMTKHIFGSGNIGAGITVPTAVIHIKAGTATASTGQIKMDVGTALTVAEAGVVNHVGTTTNSSYQVTNYVNSVATVNTIVASITKTDTGDPANGIETQMCINTFDNNIKIYADGGWRQIATW